MKRLCLLILIAVFAGLPGRAALAQVLGGAWVDQSNERIEEVRQTPVRVIVLGREGEAAGGAEVRIEQVRHAFPLGFTPTDSDWPEVGGSARLWRVMNSVSLDHFTEWGDLLSAEGPGEVESVLRKAERENLAVHWGLVLSGDIAEYPEPVARLNGAPQRAALLAWARRVLGRFGQRAEAFDLYDMPRGRDYLGEAFGEAMIRQLYQQARAAGPEPKLGLRFEDSLTGPPMQEMVNTVTGLRQAFVPIDVVSIDQKLRGQLLQNPLARAMRWLSGLDVGVQVVGLEVGGTSPAGAAVNLETLLRTLFAEPAIEGIWLGGLTEDQVTTPHAALIGEGGELTEAGRIIDRLFGELWWTSESHTADRLGNVRARVFAGEHEITATLPDGGEVTTRVWIPPSAGEQTVVLEPMKE